MRDATPGRDCSTGERWDAFDRVDDIADATSGARDHRAPFDRVANQHHDHQSAGHNDHREAAGNDYHR
ncbi:hypothetical protein BH20ACT4_BH20ACT4_13710 [soil metagenome]